MQELARLLQEERLAGATLLIMANKQDVPGALGADAIREVGVGVGLGGCLRRRLLASGLPRRLVLRQTHTRLDPLLLSSSLPHLPAS